MSPAPAFPESEWRLAADGRYERSAARVLLFDAADRLLLVRGHDTDDPGRYWWFTIGGGIDAGETARETAVRELFEETGLRVLPADLAGPVFTRVAEFEFLGRPVRQDELYFMARITGSADLDDSGWTDVERVFVDETRWWSLPDLARTDVEVFPAEMAALAASVVEGWDGALRDLGTVRET